LSLIKQFVQYRRINYAKNKKNYYTDANLSIINIEEKNNRLTAKFFVEREILINYLCKLL